MPFQRESKEIVSIANEASDDKYIVQPGNSLWRISKRIFGEGVRYTIIYESNSDFIKDPDLIYPGQILTIPVK